MSKLLLVVVVACVYGISDENCWGFSEAVCRTHSECQWYDDYYGRRQCLVPCNPDIANSNKSNTFDSEVYVDAVSGSDDNNGFNESNALKTIEQVKKCYGHNTNVTLLDTARGIYYDLVPPANLSQIEEEKNESILPYFCIEGGSQENTIIEVVSGDFQNLTIEGSYETFVICYVYAAIFKMQDLTVEVKSIQSVSHSALLWMHDKQSEVTFNNVKFNGTNFPLHVFVHTGGDLTLRRVNIAPSFNELPGNVIYWYGITVGANHTGSWIFDQVQIIGPSSNINYTYDGSLFEQVLHKSNSSNLKITLENSTFENIKWEVFRSTKRQNNADPVPIGLALTVESTNNGQIVIKNTTFAGLDVSSYPRAAPLAIVSVPTKTEADTPMLQLFSLNFTNNKGNSAGAISSNVDYSIEGTSTFRGNKKVVTDPDTFVPVGTDTVDNDLGTVLPADHSKLPKVIISEETLKSNNIVTDGKLTIAGEGPIDDNKLPVWALAIIIAVAVVVAAAIIVIVVCAVYYRNKKYSTLSDEEYDESSSSSLRSSEKDNEMDSA